MKVGFFGDTVLRKNLVLDNKLKSKILDSSFNCVNLEAPFVTSFYKSNKLGILLYSDVKCVPIFQNLNIRMVNLANNHVFDFSDEGFNETIEVLKKNNIQWFGAGRNKEEASIPLLMECNNKRYVFFGFSWKYTGSKTATKKRAGVNGINAERIRAQLEKYKHYDVKVAYFHFSTEFEDYPEPYLKELAETLVCEGYLDFIIGTHPHCIQGCENLGGKMVFYSIGNFFIPECEYYKGPIIYPEKCNIGFGVIIDFDTFQYEIVPYRISEQGTKLEYLEDFESTLNQLSGELRLKYRDYKQFYKRQRNRNDRPVFSKHEVVNSFLFFPTKIKQRFGFKYRKIIRTFLHLFGLQIHRVDGRIMIEKNGSNQ